MTDNPFIKVIALTGGPCAGKTTSLAHIQDRLTSRGFNVFIVPEAASLAILGGIPNSKTLSLVQVDFQTALVSMQVCLERIFIAAAGKAAIRTGKPSVVVCDRGALDGKAFCSPTEWQAVLDELRTSDVYLRDKRYDAVIFLQSATDGYTTANNPARTETMEEAAVLSERLMRCWEPHEHFYMIANQPSFQDKLDNLDRVIEKITGLPAPMEYERKFAIPRLTHETIVSGGGEIVQTSEITQTYLRSDNPGESERVRCRRMGDSAIYTHTVKRGHGVARVEEERRITPREYHVLLARQITGSRPLRKIRTVFKWNGVVYEHDRFLDIQLPDGMELLEIELPSADTPVTLPPFVGEARDVTDDVGYSNHALACHS